METLTFTFTSVRRDVDRPVFWGVYYFTSKEAAVKYLASAFWKGVKSNPNLVNFKEDVYGIAPFSTVSNGIPIMPASIVKPK